MNDWVAIDYTKRPNELWCKRCGVRQKMPDGATNIEVWLAIGNTFIELHRDCKESGQKEALVIPDEAFERSGVGIQGNA